jgi:hypothetical protein
MYGLRQVRFSRCKESNRISDNIDCSGTNVIATGRLRDYHKNIFSITSYRVNRPSAIVFAAFETSSYRTRDVPKSNG